MAMPSCGRDLHFSGGAGGGPALSPSSPSPSPSTPSQPVNPPHIIRPSARHTHTVILLHDVASNGRIYGRDLLSTGKTSAGRTLDYLYPGVRWVFPTAQRRPCHALGHAKVAAWFDVLSLKDPSLRQDIQRDGLCASAREIFAMLQLEQKLVPPANMVLGGMGQGCAMALAILLGLRHRIGGIVGVSGFLPFKFELEMNTADDSSSESEGESEGRAGNSTRSDTSSTTSQDPAVKAQIFQRTLLQLANADHPTKDKTSFGTPVFLGHGAMDDVLACALGEQAAVALRAAEYDVEFRRYEDHGHGYKVPGEIEDIVDFMRRRVGLEPRSD